MVLMLKKKKNDIERANLNGVNPEGDGEIKLSDAELEQAIGGWGYVEQINEGPYWGLFYEDDTQYSYYENEEKAIQAGKNKGILPEDYKKS